MLPEMNAFGDGKILGEGGVADQTNSTPLFPTSLSMTSSPAELDGTVKGTFSEGTWGGSIFLTLSLLTQRAHNIHINSNKYRKNCPKTITQCFVPSVDLTHDCIYKPIGVN
jgi:hypothetical protein